MKMFAIVIAICGLSACTASNQGAIKPDETTEQFVARVINSSGGYAGY